MNVATTIKTVKTTVGLYGKVKNIWAAIANFFKKSNEIEKTKISVPDEPDYEKLAVSDNVAERNRAAASRKTSEAMLLKLSEDGNAEVRRNAAKTMGKLRELERRRIARRKNKGNKSQK